MRRTPPLILGAGPAGCAAAIALCRAGWRPQLLDRHDAGADALCGGFLSSHTARRLEELGVDLAAAGAVPITELALHVGRRSVIRRLPEPGFALSRRVLDGALRQVAMEAGCHPAVERVRRIEGRTLVGEQRDWPFETLFLATGKHDLRGAPRVRGESDPAFGLRLRLPGAPGAQERIALHLFPGGYAGLVVQEDGGANLCMAVRKSRLAEAGGTPHALLRRLAEENPALGEWIARMEPGAPLDTIGAVPYGWIARSTPPGVFRLGDQAAVIPSLAGEGIGMAIASGIAAARAWLDAGPGAASPYQRQFAGRARRAMMTARLLLACAERPAGARALALACFAGPIPLALAFRLSRLD